MAKKDVSFESVMSRLQQGDYSFVYYLMGEESYYIDKISDYIEANAIPLEERGFNQITVYGLDTSMIDIVERARAYPMMSERQVIIVKEAQHLSRELDSLSAYLQKPQPSTILVFCHKNGTLDRRKKIAAEIEKNGVLYESKKIKESLLPAFICEYLLEKELAITNKAVQMIVEQIGSDLNRLTGELDKLVIALSDKGVQDITPELVEKLIGISKEFNVFEFRDALVNKNLYKAYQIADYFEKNSKANPIQLVTASRFAFFSNLMLAYYARNKTGVGIASALGFRSPWLARDYVIAMKNYSAHDVMRIISEIRYCDARSKGVEFSGNSGDGMISELVYKITH